MDVDVIRLSVSRVEVVGTRNGHIVCKSDGSSKYMELGLTVDAGFSTV